MEIIQKLSLTPSAFVYFTLIMNNQRALAAELCEDFLRNTVLINRSKDLGILDEADGRYNVNGARFHELVSGDDSSVSLDEFIDIYRNIFPKGVKTFDYPVRGDKKAVKKKMAKFLTNYPEYTKDIILKATRKYIRAKALNGYSGTQLAHYFIEREGVSNLASYCEDILSGSSSTTTAEGGFEENLN